MVLAYTIGDILITPQTKTPTQAHAEKHLSYGRKQFFDASLNASMSSSSSICSDSSNRDVMKSQDEVKRLGELVENLSKQQVNTESKYNALDARLQHSPTSFNQ